jgi:hypothetical protein
MLIEGRDLKCLTTEVPATEVPATEVPAPVLAPDVLVLAGTSPQHPARDDL